MKFKKRKMLYLAGCIMSVVTMAGVTAGGVYAEKSILSESISVQAADNGENVSVKQVTSGQVTSEQVTPEQITSGQITSGQITTGNSSDGNVNISYTTNVNIESSPIVETWVPKTAEEKRYYSYVGTEKLAVSSTGIIGVKVANSVQGHLCHNAFGSVLGDYTIARTYNIFPGTSNLNKPVYELEQEISITMEIPKSLQKEGRSFEMICVSKNGIPYVFADLDNNASTITIATKYFYAYALCYKD